MKRVLILAIAVMLMLTSSCGLRSIENGDAGVDTTQGEIEFYKTDADTFGIETPYCTLYYPIKWKDKVIIEAQESDGAYTVSFYAALASEKIPLYTFSFGENEEGYLLGMLDTKDGVKEVRLTDKSAEYEGSLDTTAENEFFEMCEDVNVIISKLVYESDMKLPD